MISYDLSVCVFIKDCFRGAFCLFESMYQLMPLADEFIVMDLGSTDGTLEILQDIEKHNGRVRVIHDSFYKKDASIFADLANQLVDECQGRRILYYQADEIWHEELVDLTRDALERGEDNLSFWRYQLRHNFQLIKWFPRDVHRIGTRETMLFHDDGMNTRTLGDAKMCSNWGMEYFLQWADRYKTNPPALPTHEMILDVSLTGGFLENIPDRKRMHAPFWGEDPTNPLMDIDEEQMPVNRWIIKNRTDPNWHKQTTPFNIPSIMRYHVGKTRYTLRQTLLESLKGEDEWRF